MTRGMWVRLGAIVLVVNAVQWVVVEAIAASAWRSPAYSYATNYISDLGVPDCGVRFQGRELCSPRHELMNASFALEGVLFAIGVVLIARLLDGRARRVVTVLALAHGIGMIAVGVFHGSADGPSRGLVLHVVGAGLGILCANTVAILAGVLKGPRVSTAYRVFSVAVGVLGLVCIALVGVSASTAGVFERGSVYAWLLWSAVTGMLLLARSGRGVRRPVVREGAGA
ncbi:DUF998 domain-containing protein (plasmid) [Streptomyces sp. BI20]|uniref:DUF998 domain-containing protein n=1 Tax=Streptomyces sp. BI20 TaxID=3403460 RepID=UPI003C767C04